MEIEFVQSGVSKQLEKVIWCPGWRKRRSIQVAGQEAVIANVRCEANDGRGSTADHRGPVHGAGLGTVESEPAVAEIIERDVIGIRPNCVFRVIWDDAA